MMEACIVNGDFRCESRLHRLAQLWGRAHLWSGDTYSQEFAGDTDVCIRAFVDADLFRLIPLQGENLEITLCFVCDNMSR